MLFKDFIYFLHLGISNILRDNATKYDILYTASKVKHHIYTQTKKKRPKMPFTYVVNVYSDMSLSKGHLGSRGAKHLKIN